MRKAAGRARGGIQSDALDHQQLMYGLLDMENLGGGPLAVASGGDGSLADRTGFPLDAEGIPLSSPRRPLPGVLDCLDFPECSTAS